MLSECSTLYFSDTHASVRCLPRHHPIAQRRPDRHRMRWYLQEHRQNCNLPSVTRVFTALYTCNTTTATKQIMEQFGNVGISMIVTTNQLLQIEFFFFFKGVGMLFIACMFSLKNKRPEFVSTASLNTTNSNASIFHFNKPPHPFNTRTQQHPTQ